MDFRNVDYMTLTAALAGLKAGMGGMDPTATHNTMVAIQEAMNHKRREAVEHIIMRSSGGTPVVVEKAAVGRMPRFVGEVKRIVQDNMLVHGIACNVNAKGDRIIDFVPTRPKYPYVYQSAGGTRWKQSIQQAKERFGRL